MCQALALLDQTAIGGKPGPKRRRFLCVAGDKGYDSEALRKSVRRRGMRPVFAHRKLCEGNYPARARWFDKQAYRLRCRVECLVCLLKQSRSIATRYTKLGKNYLALITLAFIEIWIDIILRYRP